jgi:hypothetical protein
MSKDNKYTKAASARHLKLFILYFNLRIKKAVTILRRIQDAYKYSIIYG